MCVMYFRVLFWEFAHTNLHVHICMLYWLVWFRAALRINATHNIASLQRIIARTMRIHPLTTPFISLHCRMCHQISLLTSFISPSNVPWILMSLIRSASPICMSVASQMTQLTDTWPNRKALSDRTSVLSSEGNSRNHNTLIADRTRCGSKWSFNRDGIPIPTHDNTTKNAKCTGD